MNAVSVDILRLATGAFFVVTGARKCFMPGVRQKVVPFIQKTTHVPAPLAYAVIAGEFLGGLGLVSGVLWRLAAILLLPIMLGAYIGDTLPTARGKQAGKAWSWSQFASNALCTPEAQLIVILAALSLS